MTEPVAARFNLARYCLAGNARLRPSKTAMILVGADTEFRMTFGQVDLAVRRLAAGLQSLGRSEEHTSELQSLMRHSYAVFCLTNNRHHTPTSKSLSLITSTHA